MYIHVYMCVYIYIHTCICIYMMTFIETLFIIATIIINNQLSIHVDGQVIVPLFNGIPYSNENE